MSDLGLKDRVILVTGGGRGLGLAYARALAAEGARIALHDGGVDREGHDPDPTVVARAAREVGGNALLTISAVLGDRASCHRLVARVVAHFGRIDGVIHNAGVVIWSDIAAVDEPAFRHAAAINHEVAFWLAQAALAPMRRQGHGRILLTGSAWSLAPNPGSGELALYCLGKAGQLGLCMALARDAGPGDIKTNILIPVAKTRVFRHPVTAGTMTPESVAGAAAWLVSPDCDISGQIVRAADGDISVMSVSSIGYHKLGGLAADPRTAGEAIRDIVAKGED